MANKKDTKKNNTKISKETYPVIKQMISSGAFTTKQICEIMKISAATLSSVRATNSLEEYKALINTYSKVAKQRAEERKKKEEEVRKTYENELQEVKNEEKAVSKEIQPNFNEVLLEQIVAELKEINKKLSQTDLLKQLEDDEDRAPKRGFFGIGKPF